MRSKRQIMRCALIAATTSTSETKDGIAKDAIKSIHANAS